MLITKRTIAIQTSKLDARQAAAKRQGSPEAFKLQLASIGQVLSANGSVDVALEYMRESNANRVPPIAKPLVCAIMAKPVVARKRA